ncbi:ABC transporter ATP-binding protein [Candidatus Bathyarchaeota archaeon]|nr:ABC transporter ATP-binding protein [Candidatus Bathyarchaeota archaeon]MBL7080330.1 ABC transporter ATP-binding protein [Candidatus Bathyarchaeota archaeon]
MAPAVEMRGITKTFPGVTANDDIDFTVEKGEIHGLLGENGAGKTVLMSVLYGLYRPDAGETYIDGERAEIESPAAAMSLGIGMVHQHFMLVPSLTVAENVVLGREPAKNGLIDEGEMLERVRASCTKYRLDVDVEAPIHTLSVGVQQKVEILKALHRGADILILDEPTAVLTPQEAEDLFRAVRSLRDQGKTVIFISHKLREVLSICDRITVLKRGKVVGTVAASETDMGELAEMMVGRRVVYSFEKAEVAPGEAVLSVEGLEALDDRGVPTLRGVDLEVRGSEILGLAGVEGNGQTELVEALMGLREAKAGRVSLCSTDITRASSYERIRAGVSHIPEDRHKRGFIPDFTVTENLILGSHREARFTRRGFVIDYEAAASHSQALVEDYSIATPGVGTHAGNLSGGNQQKVIVAREFDRDPRLVIAAQPTRGLDVGATEYVRKKLLEMRDGGSAVLLVSADLDEIWALSDRIAVIYEGRIVAVREPAETDETELGLLMTGGRRG